MTRHIFTLILGLCSFTLVLGQSNTVGVLLQTSEAFNGYTLLTVTANGETYLIDNCGESIRSWTSEYRAGMMAYLREDGSLVRAGRVLNSNFQAGGYGGIIEIFDWEGNVTWSYTMSNDSICLHHDIALMPGGHILALAWKSYDASRWIAQGRDPALTADVVWGTYIVELDPSAPLGEEIVWEWEAFNHLVQSFDSSLPNWGDPASFPTRLDVNYQAGETDRDWLHTNSIQYNADLDQILISSRDFNEIWIIDHDIPAGSTSEPEGELLYRWGNPEAYGRGTEEDRVFHSQHDARWIENGQMMVYSNGNERPEPVSAPYFSKASAFSSDSKSLIERTTFLRFRSFSAIATSRVSPPVQRSGLASAGFELIADFLIIKSVSHPIGCTFKPNFLSEEITLQEIISLTFLFIFIFGNGKKSLSNCNLT